MVPTTPTGVSTTRARTRTRRAAAVLFGTAAALAVWVVAVPLAGTELEVQSGAEAAVQEVGPASVAATSLLAALAGWALLATLERFTRRARTVWVAVALVVLALSLFGPLTQGQGTAATVTLLTMHFVEAAVVIPLLARTSPPPRLG
jgi:Family of unknown function (DUF6069)